MNTGIFISDEVKEKFSSMMGDKQIRWFQLQIKDEKFILGAEANLTENFLEDYGKMSGTVKGKEASYYVLLLENGNDILLVDYVPQSATVRTKMLYSTTLKNIISGLGGHNFIGTYHITEPEELTGEGFDWKEKKDVFMDEEEKMEFLTEEERMLAIERQSSSTVHSMSSGRSLAFPVDEEVVKSLEGFKNGSPVTVVICVKDEKIVLDKTDDSEEPDFSSLLPAKEPRFTLYRFKHEYEGDDVDTPVFIYSCPGGSKIKDKMIYSSTKGTVLSTFGNNGIQLSKSVESSDLKELTSQFFMVEVHPKKYEKKYNFKKPKRPGRGGSRRPKKAVI